MIALLTSCGRRDLLIKTIDSFLRNNHTKVFPIIIHEDSTKLIPCAIDKFKYPQTKIIYTAGAGQHSSIEKFLKKCRTKGIKYYIHLEDDWEFDNSYDWIQESFKILESDPTIIKVLGRKDSPHPCICDKSIDEINHGILQPWTGTDGITWNGFSWNPGVTRLDLLKQFIPFPKWEQELAENIHTAGYKVAALEKGIYTHIGDGRSTHK